MSFKNSQARWSLPVAWAPDIRELAQTYARSNATSSGGTASGVAHASSAHHAHAAHRSSSASSVMSEISEGLEMTQKVVKTVGAVASTAHVIAGVASGAAVGCLIM